MKKILFLGLSLIATLGFSQATFAMEGTTTVEILPSTDPLPLLYNVSDLHFGTHSQTADEQYFMAAEDLVIEVIDGREKTNGWDLQLKIGNFTNENKEVLHGTQVVMGRGEFQSVDKIGITTSEYQTEAGNSDFQTILHSDANHSRGKATYVIPQETIKLSYGSDNATGKYTAVNYWQLVDAIL